MCGTKEFGTGDVGKRRKRISTMSEKRYMQSGIDNVATMDEADEKCFESLSYARVFCG
jgi:hypothetical protein